MRTVQLAANLVTERGAESQGTAAQFRKGSQGSGIGSRIKWINDSETAFGVPIQGIKKRVTLSELKRYLKAHGKVTGIRGLLGVRP